MPTRTIIALTSITAAIAIAAYHPSQASPATQAGQASNAVVTAATVPPVCSCDYAALDKRIAALEVQVTSLQAAAVARQFDPPIDSPELWTDDNNCQRYGLRDGNDQWWDGSRWREYADRPTTSVLTRQSACGPEGCSPRRGLFGRR